MDITNTAVEIFVKNDSLISTSIEEINLKKDEFGELQIELLITNFAKKKQIF